jgi:glycogen operon protein
MVGNAINDIDERGRLVSGATLLILLNAHFECLPFVLPAVEPGHEWVRVVDTIEPRSMEARFAGSNKYPLQGRTLVLFTLNKHRGHRRASDAEDDETRRRLALQLTH